MNESRAFLIIGFLLAGATILALGFFVGGRKVEGDAGRVPELRILAPAHDDSVTRPVTISFATTAPLALHPDEGWVAGELHLHAMVDGVEIMPTANAIQPAGQNRFDWLLPATLPPGSHRIYLTWAGRHHGNLAGVTDTVTLHVRP